MSAPAGSMTVPEIVPVVVCPPRGITENVTTVKTTTKNTGVKLPMFQERCLGVCTVLCDWHSVEFLIDVFSLSDYSGNKNRNVLRAHALQGDGSLRSATESGGNLSRTVTAVNGAWKILLLSFAHRRSRWRHST